MQEMEGGQFIPTTKVGGFLAQRSVNERRLMSRAQQKEIIAVVAKMHTIKEDNNSVTYKLQENVGGHW